MISTSDEELHAVGGQRHWQESYYFNWYDPASDYFGLVRLGYRFGEGQVDAIVVTVVDGRPHYIYPGVNLAWSGGVDGLSPERGLAAGRLELRMEEPLSRWRLRLRGRHAMDLIWQATTPAFDYAMGRRPMPDDLAARHFEQSGRVRGWTEFRGRRRVVDGVGQRDKSWGVRDWSGVSGWNWISAQFAGGLSFNAWETGVGSARVVNGFVHYDGANHAIVELGTDFTWRRAQVPQAVRLEFRDDADRSFVVTGRASGQCGLIKRRHFIQETPARFIAASDGGSVAGVGVIEHTWPMGATGLLARLPELAWVAARTMRR